MEDGMAAYVIVDIDVKDPKRYAEYRQFVDATVAAYGGRYLVRGGPAENLEGSWDPKRVVVLEFESVARAKEWWDSEEYRGPKALRHASAVSNMIVVQGV
jgi:uncharacterized protein (DUF1330 family)